jgi:predicted RNA-binding protein
MCESTVYLKERGVERLLMREVAAIRPSSGKLVLTSILGDRLEIAAVVAELDLMGHRIVLETPAASPR